MSEKKNSEKKIFDEFMIDNFGKDKLNLIYKDNKELGQLKYMYKYVKDNNINFHHYLCTAKRDRWIFNNCMLPSLLYSQRTKIIMKMQELKKQDKESRKDDLPTGISQDEAEDHHYLISKCCGYMTRSFNQSILNFIRFYKQNGVSIARMCSIVEELANDKYVDENYILAVFSNKEKFLEKAKEEKPVNKNNPFIKIIFDKNVRC